MSINALKEDLVRQYHISPSEAEKMIKQAAARASVKHAVASAGKPVVVAKDLDYVENPGAWREEVQKRMQAIEIMEDGVSALDKLSKVIKRVIQSEEKMIANKTAKVNNKVDNWWDFQESGWAMGGRELFAQSLCDILHSLDEGKLAVTIVDRIGFKRTIPISDDVAPLVPMDIQPDAEERPQPSPSAHAEEEDEEEEGKATAASVAASIIQGARSHVKAAGLPSSNMLKRFMADLNKLEWETSDDGNSAVYLPKSDLMTMFKKHSVTMMLPTAGNEKPLAPGVVLYNTGEGDKFQILVEARKRAKAAWTVDPKQEKSHRDKATKEIVALTTNKYFQSIPAKEIGEILTKHGFDEEAMFGIYTGRQGKIHEQVGPKTWISMTWYKMEESGKYEIVAYLS